MATNAISDGSRITVVAPSGGVTAGGFFNVGNLFGIALANATSGSNVIMAIGGEYALRKLNGASSSYTQGALLYWDATNANVTTSATSNRLIGMATRGGANADVLAFVRLNPHFT
jgi:predicted RecA/RadA family phage recombinase